MRLFSCIGVIIWADSYISGISANPGGLADRYVRSEGILLAAGCSVGPLEQNSTVNGAMLLRKLELV